MRGCVLETNELLMFFFLAPSKKKKNPRSSLSVCGGTKYLFRDQNICFDCFQNAGSRLKVRVTVVSLHLHICVPQRVQPLPVLPVRVCVAGLDAPSGSDVGISGGEFSQCQCTGNGGFLFASDGAVVTITGGAVTNNVAERRGGAVSGSLVDPIFFV